MSQLKYADFFSNDGGLNLTDSPFRMPDSQATGGYNYEYALTGGIKKRNGHTKLNSSADTELTTQGIGVHVSSGGTKTIIRGAGQKLQKFDSSAYTFTNLTEDTVSAGTSFLGAASTQPLVFSHNDTGSANVLWCAGSGIATGKLYGVYSSSKVTQNGVTAPGGTLSLATSADAGTPNFPSTGYYRYAVAIRKTSTQALSNATAFKEIQVTTATDKVTVTLSGLTGIDTTKHDKIYIYRSSVSTSSQGDVAFTAGTLVAVVNTGTASYDDKGTYDSTTGSPSENVPGAGNLIDNSELPSTGTYKTLTTFKRCLVTASGSTIYFSDQGKPESWPDGYEIIVPSAGPITGLAVISFNTPTSVNLDEILVVFKERELWVVTGETFDDVNDPFKLRFVDQVGCPNQPLIVSGNGFLAWVDYRGVYLWDGAGKPAYVSRPIEALFSKDGELDKANLTLGWGQFFRKTNQIIWTLSHQVKGVNKYQLKLDLRLTVPNIQTSLAGRVVEGVFIQDSLPFAAYAGLSWLPTSTYEEYLYTGDNAGYMYNMFDSFADAGSSVDFSYETKFFDLGSFNTTKRFHKIIIWTKDSSDADITLDWWTKYKSDEDSKSSMSQPASQQVSEALWDLAYWDSAYWEQSVQAFNSIVFNLNGNTEGDCIKLRFRQADANAPVTIAGFTVIYTEMGLRK